MIFPKKVVQSIFKLFPGFMEKFTQKQKDTTFVIAGMLIIFQFFMRGAGWVNYRYLIYYSVGCLLLFIMILCSLSFPVRKVRIRKDMAFLWFSIGILMLLSGITKNVDYLPEALLFLFAYPLCFFVWNNTDIKSIFKLLIRSIRYSFILYIVVCIVAYPVDSARYRGLFTNENGAAGYLTLVFACLLVDILEDKRISVRLIGNILLIGMCGALVYYTGSRTGLLQCVAVSIMVLFIVSFMYHGREKHIYIRNLILVYMSIVLLFNVTLYLFQIGRLIPFEKLISGISNSGSAEIMQEEWENLEELQVEEEINQEDILMISPKDSFETTKNRVDISGKSLNQISTGRLAIWKGYFEQLNLWGHRDSGTVTFNYFGRTRTYHTSHMTILQIAYENGLIAGIFYFVFNILAGIYSIRYLIKHKNEAYSFFPLVVTVLYAIYSLLASTGISFWYMCTFYYYLVQTPLMVKDE